MKLVRQTKLHFREGNSDKIYEVDLCEVGERLIVNFRFGKRGADLKEGTKTTSPVERAEAEKIFQKLVDEKTRKGYHIAGAVREETAEPKNTISQNIDAEARRTAVLTLLKDARAKSNPRIERLIWRAGELKIKEAAAFLPGLIGTGKDVRDYCIAWSLGFCGDESSLPVLEKLAEHQAAFVRRIAREAIYKLAAGPVADRWRKQSFDALPESLKNAALSGNSENFETALRSELENQKRGSYDFLTDIYAAGDPAMRPALLKILGEAPFKPRWFKPLRHIFKIAEYRRDAEVFGLIAKRFEIEKAGYHSPYRDTFYFQNENGQWSSIKLSSEMTKEDSRLAYGTRTRDYFLRRTWRTLRRFGELGDAEFIKMAVGALLAYSDADALEPRTTTFYDYYHEGAYNWRNPRKVIIRYDAFAPYLLFNHLLYGHSRRYELKTSSRAFRLVGETGDNAPEIREESFPELWEAHPAGLLHLISESNCRPVHEFAVKVLRDCPDFLKSLDLEAVLMMLSRPYDVTAKLGFELAVARYDAAHPNVELVAAIALCNNLEARAEAFKWIDANRDLFGKNSAVMPRLLSSEHDDTRRFAAKLMQSINYNFDEARHLIALLISALLAFDETKAASAKDLAGAIFKSFGKELQSIGLDIIQDLLAHPLAEVQLLGADILLNHQMPAANLPDDLINSLIRSPFEEIRAAGVKLFGQLPDENLLNRANVIVAMLTHELADIHNSVRPIAARLATKYPPFAENLTGSIFIRLLLEETAEGLHSRLFEVLCTLPDWESYVSAGTARLLANSNYSQAAEAGGLVLQIRAAEWAEGFLAAELVDLTDAEVLSVRRASWQLAANNFEALRTEAATLIGALDSQWEDSREFWFDFFRERLTEKDLTPEILIAISDSVKPETQKFGRDLLLKYFKEENGAEYLLKLSEHPAANMQLFATNYLQTYAADSPERLARLAPYFVRLLSQVNRSRAAKNRSLQFLETEALKNADAAKIAAGILARHSGSVAVGERARMIEIMLRIGRKFPDVSLPIKIKPAEVRAGVV